MSDLQTRFARYAWWTLGLTVLVILWGTVVRATGSGAGCGSHWPLCNGVVVPLAPSAKTIIEFGHRVTSGADLLLVAFLLWTARRAWPARHRVRRAAWASLVLILIEALLGAGLVLLEYVADNAEIARGWWVGAHLLNTYLLLAALTYTAHFASGGRAFILRGRRAGMFAAVLAMVALLGMSGALTALGDTLFPVADLAAGTALTFSPDAHIFVRLRVWHPVLAVVAGVFLLAATWQTSMDAQNPRVSRLSVQLAGLFLAQMAIGVANVGLLAPVWLQVVHLLFADGIWIVLLLLAAEALADESPVVAQS
ncbi:MAG: COX15/CtaA family protein [Deltaproteobacteria bacterium]